MTIRKLWLLVLIAVSVISIAINAVILTTLTDRYFKDFLTENYTVHVNQIIDYAKATLSNDDVSYAQMAVELETHLDDPIVRIKLYQPDGQLLVDVEDDDFFTGMNDRMMGMKMMKNADDDEEIDQYTIEQDHVQLGILNITRHSTTENSFIAKKFKSNLLRNSGLSILFAIIVATIVGIIVSQKMSRSLKDTVNMANEIQVGMPVSQNRSSIKEINNLRLSLENLNTRLKLKQKSRKGLVDQLIHQTRTPLTVLKTHLEAIEDGFVEVNADEMIVCQNQINDITAIISNMGALIDADKDTDVLESELFNVHALMDQIIKGLKPQFHHKSIGLTLKNTEKIMIETDKNKLSQSLYNILTNAYKYSSEGDHVEVMYQVFDQRLVIKISDTGRGIDEQELPRIFDAYYRGGQTFSTSGEGIGLFVVKENMKKLKGDVSVHSTLNEGSIFTLTLPMN